MSRHLLALLFFLLVVLSMARPSLADDDWDDDDDDWDDDDWNQYCNGGNSVGGVCYRCDNGCTQDLSTDSSGKTTCSCDCGGETRDCYMRSGYDFDD